MPYWELAIYVFQELAFKLPPEKLSLKTRLLAVKPEGAGRVADILISPSRVSKFRV
jgi:hypothetical protein